MVTAWVTGNIQGEWENISKKTKQIKKEHRISKQITANAIITVHVDWLCFSF